MFRLISLILLLPLTTLHAIKWDPIDPADLSLKECSLDPDAEAEHIFDRTMTREWFGEISAGPFSQTARTVRTKIFTEKGAEEFSRVRVYMYSYSREPNFQAFEIRVTHPDGSTKTIKKKEASENLLSKKKDGMRFSFIYSIPDVQAGSIIDFHYDYVINSLPSGK